MFVLDSHCDTPSQIMRLRDITVDNARAHVDLPKLRRGGVDGAFFALYIPASMSSDAALAHALRLLSGVNDAIETSDGKAALTLSPAQARLNKENDIFSVFLGLENGSPIGKSLSLLRQFYLMGVRYMTLCHSADNLICDSCASSSASWNGLSPFGRDVISCMNRIGMMIDVSHISDKSFYDVLDCSSSPVVATHSCCRSLASHPRNLTDDMLRSLSAAGGVVQINFYPVFLDSGFARVLEESGIEEWGDKVEADFIADPSDPSKRDAWMHVLEELEKLPRPSYKRIVDHIEHAAEVAGIDHVGLGSDFDGIAVTPSGMEDVSRFSMIFNEMRSRGFSESDIEKVAGGNFLRVFEKVSESAATQSL